jgi:hypothetical protein
LRAQRASITYEYMSGAERDVPKNGFWSLYSPGDDGGELEPGDITAMSYDDKGRFYSRTFTPQYVPPDLARWRDFWWGIHGSVATPLGDMSCSS